MYSIVIKNIVITLIFFASENFFNTTYCTINRILEIIDMNGVNSLAKKADFKYVLLITFTFFVDYYRRISVCIKIFPLYAQTDSRCTHTYTQHPVAQSL